MPDLEIDTDDILSGADKDFGKMRRRSSDKEKKKVPAKKDTSNARKEEPNTQPKQSQGGGSSSSGASAPNQSNTGEGSESGQTVADVREEVVNQVNRTNRPLEQPSEPNRRVNAEDEGYGVTQGHDETPGGGGTSSGTSTGNQSQSNVDEATALGKNPKWKEFKVIPDLFIQVGGDRPVQMVDNVQGGSVNGLPVPLISFMQEDMKRKYVGAVVSFPWGEYKVTAENSVFTTRTTVLRYLLFHGMRDVDGSHLQYAKQWLLLKHPTIVSPDFDHNFMVQQKQSDDLDIYALLYVDHIMTRNEYADITGSSNNSSESSDQLSEVEYMMLSRVDMTMKKTDAIMNQLNNQEKSITQQLERMTMMQTVQLLDTMGLLSGGLPQDINSLVAILEKNRDELVMTEQRLDKHIMSEDDRRLQLMRDERKRKLRG